MVSSLLKGHARETKHLSTLSNEMFAELTYLHDIIKSKIQNIRHIQMSSPYSEDNSDTLRVQV